MQEKGAEKQNRKHSAVLQSIYGLVCSNSMFESCANVAVNAAILTQSVKTCVTAKYSTSRTNQPILISLVKSEPTWLHPSELKI